MHNLSLCAFQKILKSSKMSFINNLGHSSPSTGKLIRRFFRKRDELFLLFRWTNNNDMIGSHTNLSCIGEFTPHDSGGEEFEFLVTKCRCSGGVYYTWIFTTEFESVGGELFCRGDGNESGTECASCVDY